jgi:hypothetical protein
MVDYSTATFTSIQQYSPFLHDASPRDRTIITLVSCSCQSLTVLHFLIDIAWLERLAGWSHKPVANKFINLMTVWKCPEDIAFVEQYNSTHTLTHTLMLIVSCRYWILEGPQLGIESRVNSLPTFRRCLLSPFSGRHDCAVKLSVFCWLDSWWLMIAEALHSSFVHYATTYKLDHYHFSEYQLSVSDSPLFSNRYFIILAADRIVK